MHGRFARFVVGVFCGLIGGTAAQQYDGCTSGSVSDIGNGRCDAALNVPSCGFDGGDCCPCTCSDGPDHSCSDSEFDCIYPDCNDEQDFCEEEWQSDGWCDPKNNHAGCNWDGGDVSFFSFESPPILIFLLLAAAYDGRRIRGPTAPNPPPATPPGVLKSDTERVPARRDRHKPFPELSLLCGSLWGRGAVRRRLVFAHILRPCPAFLTTPNQTHHFFFPSELAVAARAVLF